MVILGVGTNVGDRLENLRRALRAIQTLAAMRVLQVSPIYISDALLPENAPADWDMPYLNLAIRCETQTSPLELLHQLKNIEWTIGRKPEARHWGPRILDIDILAWDDMVIQSEVLTVPHSNLQERPFALWPLADVAPCWVFPFEGPHHGKTAAQIVEKWGSRFTGDAPFHTRQLNHRIDTPQLVGILNVTPDSFSDGGLFLDPENAIAQLEQLVAAGADIIDVGAESTAPHAQAIDPKTEWSRLEPVLDALKSAQSRLLLPPKISVDTRHAAVAQLALIAGVDWINDVTGLDDPAMREVIAASGSDCIVMHHLNIPERREQVLPRHQNPVDLVYAWGEMRLQELEKSGIPLHNIIFDPGIGFGKMAEQSIALLKAIPRFQQLGVRLLIGHSRKTFFSLLTGRPVAERDIETMTVALWLAEQKIDYIRVHNVEMCARGFRVLRTLADL